MDLNKPSNSLGSAPPGGSPVDKDDRNWAVLAHLSALLGLVLPFGSIIAPLAIWLTKGKQSAYVRQQSLEALNFQMTVFIAISVGIVLSLFMIASPFIAILAVGDLILMILAAVAASKGEAYRYPWSLRLVR